jgi:hypothetical protein
VTITNDIYIPIRGFLIGDKKPGRKKVMLKRSDKVYYEEKNWIVYLNNRNHIKIVNVAEEKIIDYFKNANSKKNIVPANVQDKCREINQMFHSGTIWEWLENHQRKKDKGF